MYRPGTPHVGVVKQETPSGKGGEVGQKVGGGGCGSGKWGVVSIAADQA